MFKIPNNGKYAITNNSDREGNIYYTKNIDFSDGYLRLADATFSTYDTSSDAEYDTAMAMNTGDGDVWILSDDTFATYDIGLISNLRNQTTNDGAPTPSIEEDLVYFNDNWVISDNSSTEYEDGGAWTSISGVPGSSGIPGVLGLFPYQGAVLKGAGNEVALVNTSWSVVTTLVLPSNYRVLSIESNGAYAYIATINTNGGKGAMFKWDGTTSQHNGIYEVDAMEISSVRRYGSSVVCLTAGGQLLYFNGNGFQELAHFPFYTDRINRMDNSNEYGLVNNRGMVVDGDKIYISLGGQFDSFNLYKQNSPAGVWCYNPNVGLHHIYSGTKNRFYSVFVTNGDVNTTTNTMTKTSAGTLPNTGEQIYLSGFTDTTDLDIRQFFYIIKVSATEFQVARTYADAMAGNEIDLTVQPPSNYEFYVPVRLDYGATILEDRIGLALLEDQIANTKERVGRILFGVETQNNTGTSTYELCATNEVIPNRGYFVTPKLFGNNETESFSSISIKYKELGDEDSIVVKYKTHSVKGLPSAITPLAQSVTWTSNTVFTSTAELDNVQVGDEVEIVGGAGSGVLSHIADISLSGQTFTVTLEEANEFVSASDVSQVFIDNWTKLETISSGNFFDSKNVTIGDYSGWIQFKIELRGVGVTIEELLVNNKPRTAGK